MIWIFLAGLCEIGWAISMKYSLGFSRFWPSVVTVAGCIASVVLLAWGTRSMPLGTAYAIWTGIGAVGAFVAGIILFGETISALRVGSVVLIVAGLVGLKLATP